MIRSPYSGEWQKSWNYSVSARTLVSGNESSGASYIEVRTLRSAVTLNHSRAAEISKDERNQFDATQTARTF